jgi:hypothetical protein
VPLFCGVESPTTRRSFNSKAAGNNLRLSFFPQSGPASTLHDAIAAVFMIANRHTIAAAPFENGSAWADEGAFKTNLRHAIAASRDTHGNIQHAVRARMAHFQNHGFWRGRRTTVAPRGMGLSRRRQSHAAAKHKDGEDQFDGGHGNLQLDLDCALLEINSRSPIQSGPDGSDEYVSTTDMTMSLETE